MPLSWAALPVTSVGLLVATMGIAAAVVNERTAPNEVPYAFTASAQK